MTYIDVCGDDLKITDERQTVEEVKLQNERGACRNTVLMCGILNVNKTLTVVSFL